MYVCECINDCLSDPEAAAHLPRQAPWALGNLIAFEEPKPEPEKPLSLSAPFHVSIRATHTHTDRDSIIWGSHNAQSVKSVGPNTRQGHVRENLKTHTDRQRDGHDVCLAGRRRSEIACGAALRGLSGSKMLHLVDSLHGLSWLRTFSGPQPGGRWSSASAFVGGY